jgi:seryl-tRNA synthetase
VCPIRLRDSFSGHKAAPGKYTVTLTAGSEKETATAEITANPLYPTTPAEYEAYHRIMLDMEQKVTEMHRTINSLNEKRQQLDQLISRLNGDAYNDVRKKASELSAAMKVWDEDMVQRKSKAYDDVENFPTSSLPTTCSCSIRRKATFRG